MRVNLRGRSLDEVYAWTRQHLAHATEESRRRRRRVELADVGTPILYGAIAPVYGEPRDNDEDERGGTVGGSFDEFTEGSEPSAELWEELRGVWSIDSGDLVAGDDGSRVPVIQWIGPGAGQVNVRVRMVIVSVDGADDGWPMVFARGSFGGGGFSGYTCRMEDARLVLSRWDDDVETELADSVQAPAPGDVVELDVSDDSLRCYYNGAAVGSPVTDATYAAGAVGLAALHDAALKAGA